MRRLGRSLFSRVVSGVVAFAFLASTTLAQVAVAPMALASPSPAASGGVASPAQIAKTPQSPKKHAPAKVVRELPEKRTAASDSYLMSDGKIQAHLYSGPVRYKDKSGEWRSIDQRLVPGESFGDVVPASSPVSERFGDLQRASRGRALRQGLVGGHGPARRYRQRTRRDRRHGPLHERGR